MAQIGSFALLLALALSAYSFLAGLLALLRPGAGSERLGETARRAGIAWEKLPGGPESPLLRLFYLRQWCW